MRMEVTRKPGRAAANNGEVGLLVIECLDCDGVTVVATFTDIWHAEDHGPTTRLYRPGKISVGRKSCSEHNRLRPTAAPAPEAGRPAKAEINHRSAILTCIRE